MAVLVVTYDSATGIYRTQKIGSAQITDGAVVSAKIGLLAVGTPHIADAAVTSAKIASGFSPPLADGAVTSSKIASGAVGIPHIYPGAVISAKIGALAVGAPHLAALAVVSGKVASGGLSPLTSGKIWAGFTGNFPREENKPTIDVVASDVEIITDDTEGYTNETTDTKVKEIKVGQAGTLRVKFDIRTGAGTVYGRIYRNGGAVGTPQSNAANGYDTKSEDISGWTAGDLLQLYVRGYAAVNNYYRNLRVYGDNGLVWVVKSV